jgi:hypothetical protein
MDILTPKGQETLVEEARAVRLWHSKYPSFQYCETPKDTPAVVDAVLVQDGAIKGVVETKCRRDLTLEKLAQEYDWKWLVTTEKIQKGRYVAEALQVPFIGFLYLVDEDVLLHQALWKPYWGWTSFIEERKTRTQSTVNGGSIVRENSFIDMSNAKSIKGNKDGQQPTTI